MLLLLLGGDNAHGIPYTVTMYDMLCFPISLPALLPPIGSRATDFYHP
jgi:hypothetical protein